MNHNLMHPADQLVSIMNRIYKNGLTTTSGGNLSIIEENGDIWITPGGIDKGTLRRADICQVKPDGQVLGPHKPSIELPFHASIYKKRPDIKAILHAHPPHMVAFSVVRTLPDINLSPNSRIVCGDIRMAAYDVPGSSELGEIISGEFARGPNIVVLENHGLVVGDKTLFDCYMKFETLEATAELHINANKLGRLKTPSEAEYTIVSASDTNVLGNFSLINHSTSAEECAARRDMIMFIKRSCKQGLFGSTHGTYSVRLSGDSFLITPHNADRAYLAEDDLVLVKNGMKESGKTPSKSVHIHKLIYEKHPNINSVIGAAPPNAMAFAVTDTVFDPRTIPESYLLLREIKKTGFVSIFIDMEKVVDMISEKTPVLICENNQILATGNSLLHAFDRLEVCEATARAIIATKNIGDLVYISEEEIKKIDIAFNLN